MITGKINAVPSLSVVLDFEKNLEAGVQNSVSISGDINSTKTISASVNSVKTIEGSINYISEMNAEIALPKIIKAETYTGDYEVTPKSFEQELPTKSKNMKDDVLVHEIPYYETSNLTGTTVYIGGD